MVQQYSMDYAPPAPVINIQICRPDRKVITTNAEFLIDTGADITLIQKELFEQMDLEYSGYVKISGIASRPKHFLKSILLFKLTESSVFLTEVVVSPITHENILGRDILNNLKMRLDGPNSQLSVNIFASQPI